MTGKAYYITTLADWQRHAPRFANSHFIVLDACTAKSDVIPNSAAVSADGGEGSAVVLPWDGGATNLGGPAGAGENQTAPDSAQDDAFGFCSAGFQPANLPSVESRGFSPAKNDAPQAPSNAQFHPQHVFELCIDARQKMDKDADCRILVLIEADEGVHLSLEDEPAFEPLPHPLAQKPISDAAQAALAPHGVTPGATTFDAAEALARIHPLLKHRVF